MSDELREIRLRPEDLWAVCSRGAPFGNRAEEKPEIAGCIGVLGNMALIHDVDVDAALSRSNRAEAEALIDQLELEHPELVAAHEARVAEAIARQAVSDE